MDDIDYYHNKEKQGNAYVFSDSDKVLWDKYKRAK